MLDIKGAFLKGNFAEGKECVYLEVPKSFEYIYKQLGQEFKNREVTAEDILERAIEIHNE